MTAAGVFRMRSMPGSARGLPAGSSVAATNFRFIGILLVPVLYKRLHSLIILVKNSPEAFCKLSVSSA